MIIRHLILLAALSPFAAFGAEKITNFQSATYTEVVKDVNTVSTASGKAEKAKSGISFTNEDLVQSGRGSRAQLTAPDGTLIRVGPNAVFSLDKTTRAVKLESGSILFYTPPGAGGGSIVTDSATCAVTGTTIAVTQDPDVGTTLSVLEGNAKMIRKDGATNSVIGGQTCTIPNVWTPATPLVTKTFTASTFRSSVLISGFVTPLPSAGAIVSSLGALPRATPDVIASGIDLGLTRPSGATTGDGIGIIPANRQTGTTTTPAAAGQPVIPNVNLTGGLLDPKKPGQVLSNNGSGQLN